MFGKKKRPPDDDDGRTIANMNVEGMPWYHPTADKKDVKKEDKPTWREQLAMIRASYLAYLPRILAILVGFGTAIFIVYLWLHGWTL